MELENMQEWETFRLASLSMVAMVPDTMWLSQANGMHQDLMWVSLFELHRGKHTAYQYTI